MIWKIKYLKFHSNFPGANELKIITWTPAPASLSLISLFFFLILTGLLDQQVVSSCDLKVI